MLSTASILTLREEAAERAREAGLIPERAEVTHEVFQRTGRFTIPNLGDYRPEGWELVESIEPLLVDKTGWGADDEPALTIRQFAEKVRQFALAQDHYAFGIIEEGQFQIVIGVFKPADGDFTHSGALTNEELRRVRGH